MNEGTKKSISLAALAVSAGMVLSMGSALAADLGGNCCADLEERVAELEATAARKGTRKQSLEIYGLVNQAITGWDDGRRGNATIGYGNHSNQTRFGMRGSAKIGSDRSAGYSIVIDVADKGRTSTFSQAQDLGGSKMAGGGTSRSGDDYTIRMRDANWWLESSTLGRLTMGRITSEIASGSPDIAGILHIAGDDVGCNGGALNFRNSLGALSGKSINSYSSGCAGPWANRLQGMKWQSPTIAGFQFLATYGGNMKNEGSNIDSSATNAALAGQELGIGTRYAGEFNGVRLAFNAGVQWDKNNRDLAVSYSNGDTIVTNGAALGAAGSFTSADTRLVDIGGAIMHVPSGLFASGNYSRLSINQQDPATAANVVYAGARDATRWNLRAGISKNWSGLGNSSFYGEYMRHENFSYAYNVFSVDASGCKLADYTSTCNFSNGAKTKAVANGAGDNMTVWGLGFNQAIDAAAMDLYVNYRNFSARDPFVVDANKNATSLSGVSVVTTGARIRF